MVDITWKVNKCCHQTHFCIPVNIIDIISLPDGLNFYISPDTKVLSHFFPLLVSCRPENLVNSCVLCSPVAQRGPRSGFSSGGSNSNALA